MKTGLQSCNKKLSFQNTKVLVYVLIKDITGLWNHFNVQTPQIKSIEASRAKFSRLLSFVPTTGLQPRNPPIYNIFSTFFHKYTFPFFSLRGELDLQCPDSLPRPRDQHESRVFGDHSVMIRQHPDTGAVSYFESSNDLCWPIIGHLQCFFLFFFYWKLFWLELSASIHTQTQSIILMINRHER